MGRKTPVYIVCSPRPRVGKTLVARLITDFYRTDERQVVAYDIDPVEVGLTDFLPDVAQRISLSDTRDQMRLFDRLVVADDRPKVIDVGVRAMEPLFSIAADIDLAAEARAHDVAVMIVYIADGTEVSRHTYVDLRTRFSDLVFVPVYNDVVARGTDYRRLFPAGASAVQPLTIPQYTPSLAALIDKPPFSFAEFRHHPPLGVPPYRREEMNNFTNRVFRQLREIELWLLMSSLRPSLVDASRRVTAI
jgi:hypothetical protein